MNILLLLLCKILIRAVSQAISAKNRIYYPHEEDPLRIKHFAFDDDQGKTRVQNLTTYSMLTSRWMNSDATIAFHLYNQRNKCKNCSELHDVRGSFESLMRSKIYDCSKPNYFVIHGFYNTHKSKSCQTIKDAVLIKHDVNVFIVDWSAHTLDTYVKARHYVNIVGKKLGNYIKRMKYTFRLGYDMSRRAVTDGQVKYIIGLDPAGVLFAFSKREERLDENDAKMVQILHTTSVWGFRSSLGHVDFYFNGAFFQPNCDFDFFLVCAHKRSYFYYAESMVLDGFEAELCSSERCERDQCVAYMGTLELDPNASGDYCLQTNGESPYRKPFIKH
ncbi:hypothetical protein FQR65_LT11046 [Abscondita terminalis]|nr:hypothetical protein FQR65_LT11046 [Abscondita terminalis]